MRHRWVLPPSVQAAYRRELTAARRARRAGDAGTGWRHLERAHILGQMAVWPHVGIHLRMLRWAVADADVREVAGQLERVLRAGPGSYTGTVPIGDTGRAGSPYPAPAIPQDLLEVLVGGGMDIPSSRPSA